MIRSIVPAQSESEYRQQVSGISCRRLHDGISHFAAGWTHNAKFLYSYIKSFAQLILVSDIGWNETQSIAMVMKLLLETRIRLSSWKIHDYDYAFRCEKGIDLRGRGELGSYCIDFCTMHSLTTTDPMRPQPPVIRTRVSSRPRERSNGCAIVRAAKLILGSSVNVTRPRSTIVETVATGIAALRVKPLREELLLEVCTFM